MRLQNELYGGKQRSSTGRPKEFHAVGPATKNKLSAKRMT